MAEAKEQHKFKGFQLVFEQKQGDVQGGWRVYEDGNEITDVGFVNQYDALMFARGAAAYRDAQKSKCKCGGNCKCS